MARKVRIGIQDFEKITQNNSFYIDKTNFIKEWWENGDDVTLIARPRRFGKTLNISMLETFFSNKYENRGDIFEHYDIWKYEEYQRLQGTYPVISLSFANIKEKTYEQGLTDKAGVKFWYDGFTFGNVTDIYNPWSITNYLDKKKFTTYWANTSSNSLIGKLIRESGSKIKKLFESLLTGNSIDVPIDEQIVYNNLDTNEAAIWSLLLATGYLKVIEYQTGEQYTGNRKPIYKLALTNEEVKTMFYQMVSDWFGKANSNYNDFIEALISGNLKAMNAYMKNVCLSVFSYFDTGHGVGGSEPEKFYHGFVLGLMVDMSENYIIRSNRESGFGRYDIMIYPKDITKGDGIIIEFKVKDEDDERELTDTVHAALKQIDEKNYAAELRSLGFKDENIRKYGFAFNGKNVLIGE